MSATWPFLKYAIIALSLDAAAFPAYNARDNLIASWVPNSRMNGPKGETGARPVLSRNCDRIAA